MNYYNDKTTDQEFFLHLQNWKEFLFVCCSAEKKMGMKCQCEREKSSRVQYTGEGERDLKLNADLGCKARKKLFKLLFCFFSAVKELKSYFLI